ncbi:protein BEAN1 [Molossus nigricans]|uniref:Brain expressed associated with NEDD4 1 n=1 Tax=Molossus molossus TaxID=27622 RepID=A0A7J8C5M9_MOLMO|nr:brain expressed associated with NEDD4 1 [Molossus molossus]
MPFKHPCPYNDTEDKIMEHSLGVLKNEEFTTSRQRIKFYNHESQGRHNHTGHFYPGSLENSGKSNVFVSPVMVASVVIGMVVAISCITIILGSMRRERQARQSRRRRYGDYEDGQESEELTYWSRGMRYACSLVGDWPAPLDLSYHQEVDAVMLHRLYTDPPPCYEECMGPGATQLYLPTDAPPPYSLIDTSHSSGGYQQGQSSLHTISMDALPPYEAVCGAPPSLLPLPGPEPEPSSFQSSPTPNGDLVSSPERIV